MASSFRVSRIRQLLLRELSDIVMNLKDPRTGMVTIVDTEVSKDLRHAKMFISVIGSEEDQQAAQDALNHALGYIRKEVARRISLRYVPEFSVVYDDTAERAARINSLIDAANNRND